MKQKYQRSTDEAHGLLVDSSFVVISSSVPEVHIDLNGQTR